MTHSRPLKDRVIRSSVIYPAVCSNPGRPPKYKNYDVEKLFSAYEDVVYKGVSIRRAAEQYGVPFTTLADRVSGRTQFGKRSGPVRYLSDEEEDELVSFVVGYSEIGYGYTRRDIMDMVQDVVVRKGLNGTVSNGWWDGFRKRHPAVVLRKPEPMSHIRVRNDQPEVLTRYFQELETVLISNDLMDSPSLIFNMDESGFPLDPKSPHIVCRRGQRHPSLISSGKKGQITVLACCGASGHVIPPLVIFNSKVLKPELTIGEVPETMYGLTSSGWIDSEIFDGWFKNHFLAYAPASRPLLLILDGHSSHFNPDTIQKAASEKVIIFCLPPHTTHKTQPLDKGCFAPLKSFWRQECHKYLFENRGKVITRFQFSEIFGKAWQKGMTAKNVMSGFKTTGIYPFNPAALIPDPPAATSSLCERTGIKYIPFHSRRRSHFQSLRQDEPQPISRSEVESDPVISHLNSSTCIAEQRSDISNDNNNGDCHSAFIEFTHEEEVRFQKRLDEHYDLPGDERYKQWLKQRHESFRHSTPLTDDDSLPFNRTSAMSSLLRERSHEIKLPEMNKTTSSKVLTSTENIRQLQEKKKKKELELKAKEQRKLERALKKKEKEELLAKKGKILLANF